MAAPCVALNGSGQHERGLIVTVRGKGSFVVEQPVDDAPAEGDPST